jgi:hypothetical protein
MREGEPEPRLGGGAAPNAVMEVPSCAHREWVSDGRCSTGMDRAAHYRNKAERARQLADQAWQPELKNTLRSLATDYDEIAEDIESGATEIRHAELVDERERPG